MINLVQFPLQKNGTIFLTFRTIFLPSNPPETGLQSFEKSRPPKFWIPAQIRVNRHWWNDHFCRKKTKTTEVQGEKHLSKSIVFVVVFHFFTKRDHVIEFVPTSYPPFPPKFFMHFLTSQSFCFQQIWTEHHRQNKCSLVEVERPRAINDLMRLEWMTK